MLSLISAIVPPRLVVIPWTDFINQAKGGGLSLSSRSRLRGTKVTQDYGLNWSAQRDKGGMRLSYTINLNLPETSDIAVFNAIFASLRENLIKWMD
jgi:hypothetical protein